MRTILFFDLPSVSTLEKKHYRKFIRDIKKIGFYMLQESVYVKMCIDNQVSNAIIKKVESFAPPEGNIILLNVTEKQFAQMKTIIGKSKSDVISSDSRTILL